MNRSPKISKQSYIQNFFIWESIPT